METDCILCVWGDLTPLCWDDKVYPHLHAALTAAQRYVRSGASQVDVYRRHDWRIDYITTEYGD